MIEYLKACWISATEFLNKSSAPNWVAIAGLLVSVAALAIPFIYQRRDRSKLRLEARLISNYLPQNILGYIEIKIMNVGKGPMFLEKFWGGDEKGRLSGVSLRANGEFIRLDENESKILRVTHLPRMKDDYDASAMCDDEDDWIIEFTMLWVEDSLGEMHRAPNDERLLGALKVDYKEWCEITGYWKPSAEKGSPVDA